MPAKCSRCGSIDTRANNARMPRNNTAGLRVCITSDVYIYIYISAYIILASIHHSRNYAKWRRNGPTGSINDKLGETGTASPVINTMTRNHEKQVAISASLVN